MGSIQCSDKEMNDFILRGIQMSMLSFLYIATNAYRASCFEIVNNSDSKLTIYPVSSQNSSNSLMVRESFERQATDLKFNSKSDGI